MSNPASRRPNPRAEARKAAERRRRLWMIGGGIAVVVVAVAIAIASTQEAGSRVTVEDVASELEVNGDPLPPHDPAAEDPAIGTPAPAVSGTDFDGGAVEIGGGQGPQLISFLASWCPACDQEMPVLTDWLDGGGLPDGVDLVAVATFLDESRPNWPPQDWLDGHGYEGPVLVDDADATAAQTFGLSGTPYWVAVDAQGQVVHRSSGTLSVEELDRLATQLAG